MKRGQSAAEIVILIIVILVLFIGFMEVVNNRNKVSLFTSRYFSALEVGYLISQTINDVYIAGFNSNKSIFIPMRLAKNTDYNITLVGSGKQLRIQTSNQIIGFDLVAKNVSGNFTKNARNQVINNMGVVEIG